MQVNEFTRKSPRCMFETNMNLAVGFAAEAALDGSLEVDASDDDSDDSGISAFCQSSPSSTITAIMEPIFTFLEFSAF